MEKKFPTSAASMSQSVDDITAYFRLLLTSKRYGENGFQAVMGYEHLVCLG